MRLEQEPAGDHAPEERHEHRGCGVARRARVRARTPATDEEQRHADEQHRAEEVAQEEIRVERGLVAREQLGGHQRRQRVHQQQQRETGDDEEVGEPAQLRGREQPAQQQHVEEERAEHVRHAPADERRGRPAQRGGHSAEGRDIADVGADADPEPRRRAPREARGAQRQRRVEGHLEERRRHHRPRLVPGPRRSLATWSTAAHAVAIANPEPHLERIQS